MACTIASAGTITQINDLASLSADSFVVWGDAADEGNTLTSPYDRVSSGGLTVTAVHEGDFLLLVQDSAYAGNFAPGDVVLNSNFTDGPITINFASAVRGLGFQVQRDQLGDFTATLTAFGAGNVNFGSVSVDGTTAFALPGDNTAPFLGLVSSLRDIVSIQISVSHLGTDSGDTVDITNLNLLTSDPGTSEIPEPTTAGLMAAGVALLAVWKKRQK
jgi:hypothetical protein